MAQQPPADKHEKKVETKEKRTTSNDGITVKYEKETKTRTGRSRAGEVVNDTGHGIKKGASYSWDKTKHNKATRHIFNQPGS
jgi:hypothetical protein